MKRTLIVLLLVNLILSACAPASAPTSTPAPSATPLPTATATPISTATPTSTPTAIPTATPTPIPTIQVGNLSVPDPRITNPELFDLRNPDAPIPQFVNAMKMAGIEITAEHVAQGITYEALKDKDGNPFVVAVYNLDPPLFPEQYRDLAGPVPLMIAEKREKGWTWEFNKKVPLRIFADPIKLNISNLVTHYEKSKDGKDILDVFNASVITWYLKWSLVEPKQNTESYQEGTKYVDLLKRHNMEPILGPVIYKAEYPTWLEQSNLSNEELEQAIRSRVRSILQRFKGDIKYAIVVNEFHPTPYEKDYLYSRLGERYVEIAFDEARKANPEAILIYTDNAIESPRWHWYKSTYDLVRRLKTKGLIDAVGMQGHFNQPNWTKVPSNEEFIQAIRSFRQLGLDVYITEMDVSLTEKQGNDRFLYQADIYYNLIKTYLEETKDQKTRIINFFGWRDNHSWIEKDLGNYPNADPLLIDDNGNPKLAYYALLKLLYEANLKR
jgi:GH35 family endo-1,4-beta-xylanase